MEKVFPLWKNTGFFKIINVWKQFQSSMSETLNCGKWIHVPKSIGLVQWYNLTESIHEGSVFLK